MEDSLVMEKSLVEVQEKEMDILGMAFMGFLMGVASILGIWFLSGMLQVIHKMIV